MPQGSGRYFPGFANRERLGFTELWNRYSQVAAFQFLVRERSHLVVPSQEAKKGVHFWVAEKFHSETP